MNRIVVGFGLFLCTISATSQTRNAWRDSLKIAAEALSYHPDSIDLRLKKAAWNVQLEEWEYAKNEYDYVLNRQADNLAALYFRAFVNEKMRRYQFARLDYEHLLYLVPGNFEAQLGLALLNEKDHRPTEAFDGINRLITQYPDSAVAYAARANMEHARQQYELAEYDYTEALQRSPDNRDYLLARADTRIALRQRQAALDDLNRLVALGTPARSLQEFFDRIKKIKQR